MSSRSMEKLHAQNSSVVDHFRVGGLVDPAHGSPDRLVAVHRQHRHSHHLLRVDGVAVPVPEKGEL